MSQLNGPPLGAAPGALTMGGFLLEVGERHADSDCLVFDDPLTGDVVRWTYADLRRESRRVAKALLADGVTPGTFVGTLMANRPEAVAAFFGAALTGAVVVPLSTFATKRELAQLLASADVAVLLTQTRMGRRRFVDELVEVSDLTPRLRTVAAVGAETIGAEQWDTWLGTGDAVSDDDQLDAVAAGISPGDVGLVIFSSGTTSQPKGVVHNHGAPTLQFWVQSQIFGRDEHTRMWTALPIFWTAGINTAMGATLAAGGCWIMQEGFDAGTALRLLERERVTEPYTLPHQAAALAEHPDWPTTDLSSLTKVFGKSVFTRHPTVTGDPSWIMPVGYGLSETCAFVTAHPWDTPRDIAKASIGRLLPGNELRIVDTETGSVLDAGEIGEIAVRGPTLMEHYLGRTREDCLDADDFFHTGDLGSFDADGYVHFAGRRTEMIKTGGANVSPAELEVQLRSCESVKLARVIGVPDQRLDQIVVLCVELQDGHDADEADLQAFLRERVAAYKVPKRVLFFADGDIPMTASDTKVRDDALLTLVRQRLDNSSGTTPPAPPTTTPPAPATTTPPAPTTTNPPAPTTRSNQ